MVMPASSRLAVRMNASIPDAQRKTEAAPRARRVRATRLSPTEAEPVRGVCREPNEHAGCQHPGDQQGEAQHVSGFEAHAVSPLSTTHRTPAEQSAETLFTPLQPTRRGTDTSPEGAV